MNLKKKISVLLSCACVLPCLGMTVSALGSNSARAGGRVDMSSEIVIKNGAAAVVSMTYDDGKYDSVVWTNEMLKKYGLKASSMLIASRINNGSYPGTLKEWQELFAEGYISPENHSMTHSTIMPGTEWSKYEQYKHNNTEENYKTEILDSKAMLEGYFGQPILTFAPSNNTLWTDAAAVVMANYYAMRKGTRANSHNTVQSISPIEGSDAYGGWYNPYMYGIDTTTLEQNKAWVEDCIDAGGWFISMTHEILNSSDGADKPEKFEAFYQFLAEKQAANEIWVASFSEATVYLREKQNSSVSAYMTDEGVFVKIKMNDTTGDGLSLSSDIFNMPLTVKVEVPEEWGIVSYKLGKNTAYATAFSEGGKKYAYVDVIPNKTSTQLTPVTSTPYVSLSLADELELGIYIDKTDVSSVSVGDTVYDSTALADVPTKMLGDKECYVFSAPVSYYDLEENVNVKLSVNLADGMVEGKYVLSAFAYIENLLSRTKSEAEKQLALDILSYAKSASVFENSDADMSRVGNLLKEHSYIDNLNVSSDTRVFTPDKALIEKVVATPNGGVLLVFTPAAKYRTENSSVSFKTGRLVLNAVRDADGNYKLKLPIHLSAARITITLTDEAGDVAITEYNLNATIKTSTNLALTKALTRLAKCSESAGAYKNAMDE